MAETHLEPIRTSTMGLSRVQLLTISEKRLHPRCKD